MTLRLTTSDRTAAAMRIIATEPALVSAILQDPNADRDIAERLRILLTKPELQARVTFAAQRNRNAL
jgi:hypothetical protein